MVGEGAAAVKWGRIVRSAGSRQGPGGGGERRVASLSTHNEHASKVVDDSVAQPEGEGQQDAPRDLDSNLKRVPEPQG